MTGDGNDSTMESTLTSSAGVGTEATGRNNTMTNLTDVVDELQNLLKLQDRIELLERKIKHVDSTLSHQIANLQGRIEAKATLTKDYPDPHVS